MKPDYQQRSVAVQTEEMYNVAVATKAFAHLDYTYKGVPEAKEQAKIISYLTNKGFEVTKVITATKSATSDIISLSPDGRFWRIEVKRVDKGGTPAQLAKLKSAWHLDALVMVACGYNDFLVKYRLLTVGVDDHIITPDTRQPKQSPSL